MKLSAKMKQAEKHRAAMISITNQIASKIQNLLGEENMVDVIFQSGDGWVVVFDDAINAKIEFSEYDILLKMSRDDAREFLISKSI